MASSNWLSSFGRWLMAVRHPTRGSTTVVPSTLPSSSTISKTQCESDYKKLRREFKSAGDCDLHDFLRQRNRIGWCEWHLNIDGNDNAIRIAQLFHHNASKSKLSSSVADAVDTIEEMVLKLTLTIDERNRIKRDLKEARKGESLLPIIKIYTIYQPFSRRLNQYLAANTHHALKFYCTLLNCPALARTQEYTETFTSVLFQPELEKYIVRQKTVYRGIILKDKKFIENYKEGATIITTAVLSTSTEYAIARLYADSPFEDDISIMCTYIINNTKRRTALDLKELSQHPEEEEILILPYVPFTIKSLEQMDDGRKMRIRFEECKE